MHFFKRFVPAFGGIFFKVADLHLFAQHLHRNEVPGIKNWEIVLSPTHKMTGLERGLNEKYAQGFIVTKNSGNTFIGHDGGDVGYSSSFLINKNDGTSIIILSNNSNVPSIYVMDNLIKLIYGEKYDTPQKSFSSFIADEINDHDLAYLETNFKESAVQNGYPVDNPMQLIQVAEQITSSGFYELAFKIHQLNTALFPDSPMPYCATAEYCYWGTSEIDKAKDYFNRSLARFPKDEYATKRLKEIEDEE